MCWGLRHNAALIGALAAAGVAAGAGPDALKGTSSDDHLWVVVRTAGPEPRLELRHHAGSMGGPYSSRGVALATKDPNDIEAMAAWGNQLWMVLRPRPQDPSRREVFTVQVHRDPGLGSWFHKPHDHLRAVTGLDGRDELAGFVGTAGGPVALLVPRSAAQPARRAAPGEEGPDRGTATLVELSERRWVDLSLPADFRPGPLCRLGAAGTRGERLVVLSALRDRSKTAVLRRAADGRWTETSVDLELAGVRAVTRVGSNIVLVRDVADPRGVFALDFLRPLQLLSLSTPPRPTGPWAALGLRGVVKVIEQTGGGELAVRTVDPLTGDVGPRLAMGVQPVMTGRMLHRPFLLAVGITALMVILFFKPPTGTTLPEGVAVLGAAPRLVAALIDLAAAGAVTVAVLHYSPRELLAWPLWTVDVSQSVPCLIMIGLTVAHCTISELVTTRTLGKKLVGSSVAACDGTRPGAVAVLIRNAFKAVILLIPVLAVFALLNPHVQGLGDLVAKTVVVRDAAPPSPAPPKDR